jgi:hypothetical protein
VVDESTDAISVNVVVHGTCTGVGVDPAGTIYVANERVRPAAGRQRRGGATAAGRLANGTASAPMRLALAIEPAW